MWAFFYMFIFFLYKWTTYKKHKLVINIIGLHMFVTLGDFMFKKLLAIFLFFGFSSYAELPADFAQSCIALVQPYAHNQQLQSEQILLVPAQNRAEIAYNQELVSNDGSYLRYKANCYFEPQTNQIQFVTGPEVEPENLKKLCLIAALDGAKQKYGTESVVLPQSMAQMNNLTAEIEPTATGGNIFKFAFYFNERLIKHWKVPPLTKTKINCVVTQPDASKPNLETQASFDAKFR